MGTVVLSFDADLAWSRSTDGSGRGERLRRLLDALASTAVPATWTVAGQLFSEGRAGDLLAQLTTTSVGHEVAGRPFSDACFDAETTPRDVAAAEIRSTIEAAGEYGFSLETFAFPADVVDHLDVLAAYGVRAYRTRGPVAWYDRSPLLRLLAWAATTATPRLSEPTVDDRGMVAIPVSMRLLPFGPGHRFAAGTVARHATRGIERVADTDGVFHAWAPLAALTTEPALDVVETVLSVIEEWRAKSDLSVATMAELAAASRPPDPVSAPPGRH